jgi:hypothetical protein
MRKILLSFLTVQNVEQAFSPIRIIPRLYPCNNMVRFLVAFSVSGVFECGFVLVTEIVSPGLRTPFGIMTQFPFGIGASLLPLGIHALHKH